MKFNTATKYETPFPYADDDRPLGPHLEYVFAVHFDAREVREGSGERTIEIVILSYELSDVSIWPDEGQGFDVTANTCKMGDALAAWFESKVQFNKGLRDRVTGTCLAAYERQRDDD